MKKILFLASALLSMMTYAQVLESDNYNSYNLGNVSTALTSVGQGGMNLDGGTVANYQIVTGDAQHGKYISITTGSDGTAASGRFVYKNGLNALWNNRTAGNNIIKGTFEIFTGTSTNKHLSGMSLYSTGATAGSVGDGIVGIGYNSQTKLINGRAYLDIAADPFASGFYTITGISTTVYPANTWLTVGFSYNTISGAITYNVAGNTVNLTVNGASTVAGLVPAELDIQSSPTRTSATDPVNSGPTTFGIDNYNFEASSSATLSTNDVIKKPTSIIAIGPNPAVDFLNILTDQKIINVEIIDMSGKKVLSSKENKINVSLLSAGTYLINIITNEGKTVEKFIKK